MTTITPTILTSSFKEFAKQVKRLEGLFDYVQIDVMDGIFVNNKSFEDVESVNKIKTSLQYELHLMVQDPIKEMEKWKKIKNVFRIIFHLEAAADPVACINYAHDKSWEVGMALNPDTPLSKIKPFLNRLNLVLLMTVYPGHQGAPFVPKVKEKIKEFVKIPDRPLCAVDGAVSKNNIKELAKLGVDIFNIGSLLTREKDVKKTCKELKKSLKD